MKSLVYQMRTFFANLVFTMIVSALWSLCFEMPFMIIDNILSGRKQNLSKHLKAYDSGKEIYHSKESSIMFDNDNPGECGIARHDLMRTAKENCENSVGDINDEAERNIGKIYFINPIKRDKTRSAVNSDNRRSNYIVDRIIDKYERSKANSNGKESESVDIDPVHRTKSVFEG